MPNQFDQVDHQSIVGTSTSVVLGMLVKHGIQKQHGSFRSSRRVVAQNSANRVRSCLGKAKDEGVGVANVVEYGRGVVGVEMHQVFQVDNRYVFQ